MLAEREPWRHEAELTCLNSGAENDTAGRVRISAIEGPGACGIDYPLRVSALGESAPLFYDDEPVPPGAIPSTSMPRTSMPQNWPGASPSIQSSPLPPVQAAAPQSYPSPRPYSSSQPYQPPQSVFGAASLHPSRTAAFARSAGFDTVRRRQPHLAFRAARLTLITGTGRADLFASGTATTARQRAHAATRATRADDRCIGRAGAKCSRRRRWRARSSRARPLVRQRGAAGSAQVVRPAGGRDQANLRLFVPRHERPARRAYFRACLRQRARHRGLRCSRTAIGSRVKDGWRGTPEEQGFLHDVQVAACDQFTTVLAPGSNAFTTTTSTSI